MVTRRNTAEAVPPRRSLEVVDGGDKKLRNLGRRWKSLPIAGLSSRKSRLQSIDPFNLSQITTRQPGPSARRAERNAVSPVRGCRSARSTRDHTRLHSRSGPSPSARGDDVITRSRVDVEALAPSPVPDIQSPRYGASRNAECGMRNAERIHEFADCSAFRIPH